MSAKSDAAPTCEAGAGATARTATDERSELSTTARLLIAVGGTLLRAPCPVDSEHRAVLDLETRVVTCGDCRLLRLDLDAYRTILDFRHLAVERESELEELLAGLDLRDRAGRARALRMEDLYLDGLAESTP